MKIIRTCMPPAIAAAIAVAGCATYGTQSPADVTTYDTRPSYEYQSQRQAQNQLHAYGVVDRIEVINKGAASNAAGTVIGGIVGGLIGHQIGSGSGNTAATILGAAGGAVAGHEIQRRSRGPNETFRVTVRLDSGDFYVVTQDNISDLRPGDRVRLEGNRIYRV